MANTMKFSSTANKVPAASALVPRELAINTTDGKVHTPKEDGTVALIGANDLVLTTICQKSDLPLQLTERVIQ